MVLAAGSFADDLRVRPMQAAEVDRQSDPSQARGGRRATALSNGNVILDAKRKRRDFFIFGPQDFTIGIEDEMVRELFANVAVPSRGGNREFIRGAGVELDMKIHRQSGSIEGRTEIRGRSREGETQSGLSGLQWHVHVSSFDVLPAAARACAESARDATRASRCGETAAL